MSNFTAPEIPQILSIKHWQATKDIPESIKDDSPCEDALLELAKAYKKAGFESLAPFFKQTPAWAQYNYKRWSKLCDDLVREIIVGGVINLRESLGEVRNAALRTEKSVDKKAPLAAKSSSLLRKMAQAADAMLKELRPDIIEASIRKKEKSINDTMLATGAAPLNDIKKHAAKAKGAVSIVLRAPTPANYNKVIGSGAGGLARDLASSLLALAALPTTKGIDYDGAGDCARMAKTLLTTAPLQATADKGAVTGAIKEFLQIVAAASKLPKLKL